MISLFIALASAINFSEWTAKHNQRFSGVELLRRRAVFKMNSHFVAEHNKHSTFQLTNEGPFAAMTREEYRALLKAKRPSSNAQEAHLDVAAPASLDLRTSGKVPPIRDQAQCGSCYSFGALASLEGRLLMLSNPKDSASTIDLSEQQIVRCSENNGCEGGTGSVVYDYIKANGVVKEKDYPYTATDGTCGVDKSKRYAKLTGYVSVAKKNNDQLKAALVSGIVDVSIDASSTKFQLYKSGVYVDTTCRTSLFDLNHEVAAVGYGTSNGQNYWIVRNSWGTSWGDKGYILMAEAGNTCGVTTDPIYPTGVAYY